MNYVPYTLLALIQAAKADAGIWCPHRPRGTASKSHRPTPRDYSGLTVRFGRVELGGRARVKGLRP